MREIEKQIRDCILSAASLIQDGALDGQHVLDQELVEIDVETAVTLLKKLRLLEEKDGQS